MNESRSHLGELIGNASASLKIVSAHFKIGVVTRNELKECSDMLTALADALKLYTDKMPGSQSDGRHVREPPDS